MFYLVSLWFKSLSKTYKAFLVVVLMLLAVISYQSGRYMYVKYKYIKTLEKELTTLKKDIQDSESEELNIVKENNEISKKTKVKNQTINKKLKQDEEDIDNSSIGDDEIRRFVSKHTKGQH